MSQFTIGLDIGTTGTKAVLFEAGTGVVASATAESTLHSPHAGWAEADTEQWRSNVYSTVRELLQSSGCSADQVLGISTTGMVPAVVLLDEAGKAVSRAVLQNDARAVAEISLVADALGDRDVVSETGSPLSQQSLAPTLRWFQAHEPELWSRTATVVGSYDWVLMALGAAAHVEKNWALESGLFYIDGGLHEEILEVAGVPRGLLPTVRSAVGSSAITIFGSQDKASAITALCFIPPDNSCGNLSIIESSRPTILNNSDILSVFSFLVLLG